MPPAAGNASGSGAGPPSPAVLAGMAAKGWVFNRRTGPAAELHTMDTGSGRSVWQMEVDRTTMVLGSTQPESVVDTGELARRDIDLTRRRSGGGAVLLVPGEHIWVDLVVPAGDPLWVDDVEAATWWLGDAWSSALSSLGITCGIHDRGVSDRESGRVACFAALGPGEVSVAGAKLIGISQRRTRDMARFQCVVHRRFDPQLMSSLLAESASLTPIRTALATGVVDLDGLAVDPEWSVVEGLIAALP